MWLEGTRVRLQGYGSRKSDDKVKEALRVAGQREKG